MTCQLLLVDDDDAFREALAEAMREEGFAVLSAPNGESALDWLAGTEELPDGIVLDLLMPGIGGRATLDRLKADPRTRRIPVVVLSGEDREWPDESEAAAFFTKPPVLDRLFMVLHWICDLRQLPSEG